MSLERAAKQQLRREIRSRIERLCPQARARADAAICSRLVSLANESGARFAVGYIALRDEAPVDAALCDLIESGMTVYLPCSRADRLLFGRWVPTAKISRDEKGVLAPSAAGLSALPPGPGVVLVPGRAFDAAGHRLGRGGGYYDRFLTTLTEVPLVVGVAYECQFVASVPCEAHDRTVAVVVTESQLRTAD